ncbi:MAG TPA: BatA domain-containing protein [Bryobacteraceae bacterium]|nr:BatA domain-containing protein [Bryobacteraceae bacterium]
MGFLTPWFLAGAAAIGLPVWLHLLRRHRSTPLPFSSLRFFERRTQSSVRHRRLRYLLLFALRTLVIALLVLAFANPFIRRQGGAAAGNRRLVVAAIDESFSMRYTGRLERAKQEAARVVAGIGGGDRGQVLAFGSRVRTMTDATPDVSVLQAGVRAVEAGDSRGSYAELARALRSMGQTAGVPVEAHVFSDMQKSSLPPNFADLSLPGSVRLVTHPVTAERVANVTVESVRAPRRVYDQRKVGVEATVANFGAAAETRRAALVLNGREIESHNVEIPAGGRAVVEFANLEAPFGMRRCEVKLSPADGLPEDDLFHFSVERAEPRPALFVEEPNHGRGLLYFRAALEASAQSAFRLEPVNAGQTANLNPAKYAFVVLSDVAAVPAAFEEALKRYVRGGGAVLVALGRMGASRGRVPVSGEAIVEARYFAREAERFETASWLDPAHPALAKSSRWDGVRFYQAVKVEPAGAQVAARLSGGTPLLIDRKMGEGRVLVFASTFDNISNDLPLDAAFVPFVEQTARYLGRLEDGPAGDTVDSHYELGEGRGGAAAEVLGPDAKRLLSLDEAARARSVPLAHAGFYEVKHPNERRELVAVNVDRRESDLDVIPAETLALWGNAPGNPAAGGGVAAEEPRPVELGWYVLVAVLALVLAESWLGNRHLAVEREPEQEAARKEAA